VGSLFYVSTYLAIARNTSATALASALAAVPRDVDSEALTGLQNLADITVSFSNLYARRSLTYTAAPNAIATDPILGSFLINQYTSSFSQALSTPVTAGGVVNVPRPSPPLVWVNAQYGVAGGPVSSWPNLSGNNTNLVQSAAAHQPTMIPSGFAPDVATVSFDGVKRILQSAAPLTFDDVTYMISFQSPAPSTAGMLLERSIDAAANSGERLYQASAPPHSILATRAAVTHSGDAPGPKWGVDGQWHVATFVYSAAAGGKLIVDGATLATFASLPAQPVTDTLFVGSNQALTLPMTGAVRELFVFPVALSDEQIAAVAAYMGPQVGIAN
jgi:hypothetical protein